MMAHGSYQSDYIFPHPVDERDRVGMMEWKRLKGCTGYKQLRWWVSTGPKLRSGERLKLPTFEFSGRTYTTTDAYLWWIQQQQEA